LLLLLILLVSAALFFMESLFLASQKNQDFAFLFLLPQQCIFTQHCCITCRPCRHPDVTLESGLVLYTCIELLSAALVYNFKKKIIMPLSTTF